MSLGSMATNRYSAPFREDVQAWIVKLSTVGEIIEQVRVGVCAFFRVYMAL
jgi:dynein heavy chain